MGNYPIVLRNYLFALGIFASVSTASEAFIQGSFGDLDYVNFMMDEFYYLNITSLGRNLLEHQSDCGFACLEIPPCISYNVAAFPDINGKLLCELLPSDKYNNSDKFISSQYFHHFSIPGLVLSNYKEPINGNFDDCTKEVLAEIQAEGSSKSEEEC